jgi:hypothetical protein
VRVEDGVIVVRVPAADASSDKYVCHSLDTDTNVAAWYLVDDVPHVYRRSHDDQRG